MVTALVVPFELASPSPSADMLPVRVRLDARESVEGCVAGELEAPSGSWAEPSSASARRLRPSTWRVPESVVEARAPCLGASELGRGTVGSALWCWEAAAPVEDGAEMSVLEGGRGCGVLDGWSALDGVVMGAGERGLRSATASSAGVSISRCVCPLTGRNLGDKMMLSCLVQIGEAQVRVDCLLESVSGACSCLSLGDSSRDVWTMYVESTGRVRRAWMTASAGFGSSGQCSWLLAEAAYRAAACVAACLARPCSQCK